MMADLGASPDGDRATHERGQSPLSPPAVGIPSAARRLDLQSISAWPERRPPRAEAERTAIAERFAAHLPKKRIARAIDEEDILAMRAAFIRRFDEQLPRTETLMAVAHIGYRMALRDLASGALTEGGDAKQAPGDSLSGPAPERGDAQPSGTQP